MPFLDSSILVSSIFKADFWLWIIYKKKYIKNADNGDDNDDDDNVDRRDPFWPRDYNELYTIFNFYSDSVKLVLFVPLKH